MENESKLVKDKDKWEMPKCSAAEIYWNNAPKKKKKINKNISYTKY